MAHIAKGQCLVADATDDKYVIRKCCDVKKIKFKYEDRVNDIKLMKTINKTVKFIWADLGELITIKLKSFLRKA